MNTPLTLAGFGFGRGLVAAFGAAVPSAGTYRLLLDFEHGSVVRTAAFTVAATTTHEEGGP
jgi:hypothetical protein